MEDKLKTTIKFLENSYHKLRGYKENQIINISYLEGIAEARFALAEVAEFMNDLLPSSFSSIPVLLASNVMPSVKRLCEDPKINSTATVLGADLSGPIIYLIKLLVRQFGFPFLKSISKKYQWIVPKDLDESEEVCLM